MSAALADTWADLALRGLLHGSLAFAVLYALWWPWRRRAPAQLACVLFSLALLKVALPVELPAPPWLAPLAMDGWLPVPATETPLAVPREGPAGSTSATLVELPRAARSSGLPAAARAIDMQALLFWGWVAGVALLSLRFLRNELRTVRAVRAARPVSTAEVGVDLEALRARAGVGRRVRWLASDCVATPAAGGLFRPYVLLPVGLAAHLPPRQLTFVLLHELAHIRRGDLAVAAAQRLVQILWFFHPVVWLASRLVEQHRELACDQDALARSGASRRECGAAFLSVVAWVNGRHVEPTATLAMFDPTRVLKRRLMQILTDNRSGRTSRWLGAAYLAFAAAVTLPSAKATASPTLDLPAFEMQDEGQQGEIAKLRAALAELRKQQADLARQLAELHAGKAKRAGRAAKHDDDDDDDAEAGAGKPKKSATRAFTFDGEHTGKMDGGAFTFDGKKVTAEGNPFTYLGKGAQWFATKGDEGGWKVLRAGQGEDGKVFHVWGGDGAHAFEVDGEDGGQIKWVSPRGEWKKAFMRGGLRMTPGVKVELGEDGAVYRFETRGDDGDADEAGQRGKGKAEAEARSGQAEETEETDVIVEKPKSRRVLRQVEGQPIKLRRVENSEGAAKSESKKIVRV